MFGRNAKGWIGVDVGGSSVKTVQAVRRGGRYFVSGASLVERRERWNLAESVPAEPSSSADEMKTAASVCGMLRGRSAAAVMPMGPCETAQLEAAAASRRESENLAAVVAAETQRPVVNHIVRAWQAPLQQGRINVITAPAAWSDQIYRDVRCSGWQCRTIESLPWALARAVRLTEAPAEATTVAALDWGYSRVTMCLVHNGVPAIVRQLKGGGFAEYVTAVEHALRVSSAEAERLLRRHRLSARTAGGTSSASAIDDALGALLGRLENELHRTIAFWQSQTRGLRPVRLYVFGAGGSLAGVAPWIQRALDVETRLWDLPLDRGVDDSLVPPRHLLGPSPAASASAWETP